ncbi:MAG: hypothetical protein HW377_2380, partial [Actinobacteria bacterium]|nr:hypothetical protein [Actinomycetota bacterium]
RYNPNGEWGFQAILYLVFSVGGVYGVSFLVWAVVFATFLLLHRAAILRGAHPLLAVLAIFAFSGFLRIRIQPRPEIFTYFFIALTIFLFSEFFFGTRKRLIYLFPPAVLVWANAHPTYLMAFLLSGAFVADRLAHAIWRKEFRWGTLKAWIFPPVLVGLAGLILCGLNPHGYNAILAPLHLLARGTGGGGGGSSILMSISELTPVKGTGFFIYYKAAVAFAVVSLLLGLAGRKVYLLDLFLFAIAFKGSWDSARAVSMMGLFLSQGTSLHLTGFFSRLPEWFPGGTVGKAKLPPKEKQRRKEKAPLRETPVPERRRRPLVPSVLASLAVFAMIAFGGTTLVFSFSQLEYGVGMTEHKFSFPAAEFLRKNPVPGKMFNFFDIGGFLDWKLYPQALTFIDGRTYNQEVFMEHQVVTGAMPGWEKVLEKYGINYIVLKSMDSSGMILPIVPVLANNPNWPLVFSDGLFVVFVRNAPELRGYIKAHQIPKGILPQHIIREAYHYMFLGVSPVTSYQTMSNMFLLLGQRDKAIWALRQALETVDDPYLRARLTQLQGGVGTR